MKDVSLFIDSPKDSDVPVSSVFTQNMFEELISSLAENSIEGLLDLREHWNNDVKDRKIISEFLKDANLGKKRFISMPDRITNTISFKNGKSAYRPSVINCYSESLFSSRDDWWRKWQLFMFNHPILVEGRSDAVKPIYMLVKINRSKYPALSEKEENISIPLQTLSLAIFDSILIHMMNALSSSWQTIRANICSNLNLRKNDRSRDILETKYSHYDVMFLQEVSSSFISSLRSSSIIDSKFHISIPMLTSKHSDRDQKSVILFSKDRFLVLQDVTSEVTQGFPLGKRVPIEEGDLLAVLAEDMLDNTVFLLCSFHGDTNGLATVPVVRAVHQYATSKHREAKLLFGMDANTYATPEPDQQGVTEFGLTMVSLKLSSCYGDSPDPSQHTTFAARTHLQPQLNKAVAYEERDIKGDKNPKDFIIFFKADFIERDAKRDNTGKGIFIDNMVIPTLKFPSDHAITSANLAATENS